MARHCTVHPYSYVTVRDGISDIEIKIILIILSEW